MFAIIFPEKGRTLELHRFCLTEKQKNIIHNLKLKTGDYFSIKSHNEMLMANTKPLASILSGRSTLKTPASQGFQGLRELFHFAAPQE